MTGLAIMIGQFRVAFFLCIKETSIANHSYENQLYLQVNQNSFSDKRLHLASLENLRYLGNGLQPSFRNSVLMCPTTKVNIHLLYMAKMPENKVFVRGYFL